MGLVERLPAHVIRLIFAADTQRDAVVYDPPSAVACRASSRWAWVLPLEVAQRGGVSM